MTKEESHQSREGEEEAEAASIPPRSAIADEISDLKTTILRVASERERLPQPLFWSLFRTRLESIRKEKELQRVVAEVLHSK